MTWTARLFYSEETPEFCSRDLARLCGSVEAGNQRMVLLEMAIQYRANYISELCLC